MNVTKDKAKSPDKPVLENEKTLFSSGTPAFYADRNQDGSENKASKMKETIGKASKNLHSTLQNAKEKVVNILSSKLDGHTGENETPSHNNKNETLNNDSNETSYPSATKNLFAAKEFIDEEIGFSLPPAPPNSASSTVDNDEVATESYLKLIFGDSPDLQLVRSEDKEQGSSCLTQTQETTLVKQTTETEAMNITVAQDTAADEVQRRIVETSPNSVDEAIVLALLDGGAVGPKSQNDESVGPLKEKLGLLCNQLVDSSDDQAVVESLDALEDMFRQASARGELNHFREYAVECGGVEKIERLMGHPNSRIASRVESLRQSYLLGAEKVADWAESDVIAGLCGDLKSDDQEAVDAMGRLSAYLGSVSKQKLNDVLMQVEECGGMHRLDMLSGHRQTEQCRQPAATLLRTYFSENHLTFFEGTRDVENGVEGGEGAVSEEEQEEEEDYAEKGFDSDDPDCLGEVFTNVQQLCEMLATDDEQAVLSALDTLAEMLDDLGGEETGPLLVRVLELVAVCGGEEVMRALVDHENGDIQERAASLMSAFFQPQLQANDSYCSEIPFVDYATSGSSLDQIAHRVQQGHVQELCGQLKGEEEGDNQVVTQALQGLRDIMDALGCNPLLLRVLQIVSECGGEKALVMLCRHENPEIRERAREMLDVYFGDEEVVEEAMLAESILGHGSDEEDEDALGVEEAQLGDDREEDNSDNDDDDDTGEINYGLI